MDLRRVVAVRGSDGPGSGYVLAERLVLTSAHVVGEVESACTVFFPGHEPVYRGVVVWRGTPGGP